MAATPLTIPITPEELTPAWLTDALRAGGVLRSGAVRDVRREVLGQGVGFVGQVVRLTLNYDPPGAGAATMIAKMPAADEGGRALAALYGLYEREYRFYRELAAEIPLRTARCYYADGDAERVSYILLLEDLGATGRAGDQVQGCTAGEMRLALAKLAQHHAHWWGDARLTELPWITSGIDLVNAAMTMAYAASWPKALELMGDHLPQEVREVIPTMAPRITKLMEPFAEMTPTLAHGDYRLDNMFFGDAGADYDVAVIDWQSPSRAWGAYDIAYFLYGNVETETRRAHEMAALREYYRVLMERPAAAYSFDELMRDYRASLLVSLAIMVVNAGTLDTANERGTALFEMFFDRLAAAIMDHRALELLPE
jgi:hypothetical protein